MSADTDAHGRCASCKFWDADAEMYHFVNEWESRETRLLRADSPDEEWAEAEGRAHRKVEFWGECRAIRQKENAPDDAIAMLSDGSGYYAGLATRGEFGCVLWEAKDEENYDFDPEVLEAERTAT